jgi:signal transduction histidine kinase
MTAANRHASSRVRERRVGLRVRVTVAFAVLSMVVVLALSLVTYFLAQHYLLQQRERSATRQAFLNARLVRDALVGSSVAPTEALELLELSPRSQAAFVRADQWYGTTVALGPGRLPSRFITLVNAGTAAHQRLELVGERRFVIGVPITAADGVYIESFSLGELEDTLMVLRNVLIACVLVTPVAAGLLGLWASRRVLRPVGEVSSAAAQIAAGDLDARLKPPGDPDLARMATSFNAMVDALTERMERDERFAGDVSHELRSSLTTLAAAASVLEARRDELSPQNRQAVELVIGEVDQFRELVEALLELSRLQAGADALHLEPVRLGELILHVARNTATDSLAVEIAPSVDESPVIVDKRRLERVLTNLLVNASEHAGGATRVTAERDGDRVRIAIEDEGPGVRPEDRALIFERFARGRRAGSRGSTFGTGLGLALVAEHVRLHQGRVWVEDRPCSPGARFVVELPVEPS